MCTDACVYFNTPRAGRAGLEKLFHHRTSEKETMILLFGSRLQTTAALNNGGIRRERRRQRTEMYADSQLVEQFCFVALSKPNT
jgi:hypothetical protein